ncbi:MAG: tRNA epoxyqueuosine(34) reductase QueG [Sedimentisphaerales bacterium]|nr:tRNA epoxyqueuosine(34) reductase QueG [Sedimentisphaerales bacterium]
MNDDIKRKAIESGFDLIGITDVSPIDAAQVDFFSSWLKSGFAGQMNYMHRNFKKRFNPAGLLEDAQSVIVTGLNYKPPKLKRQHPDKEVPTGKIVSYAQYEDYHPFIEKLLRNLIDYISSVTKQEIRYKICVDSSALAERALAVRAGLGFIGKNHMLINPKLGCQIFLGEIITDLKLLPDKPPFCHSERSEAEPRNLSDTNCSTCNKCIEACPTGALRPDGQFDANKCINYLTIEYKGEIPADLAEITGDRLFGCEECILACPYYKNAPVCKNQRFKFHKDRKELSLPEVLSLGAESFDAKFHDSPIKRPGLERLKRNARICLENTNPSGGQDLVDVLKPK